MLQVVTHTHSSVSVSVRGVVSRCLQIEGEKKQKTKNKTVNEISVLFPIWGILLIQNQG
jgi:hypothetical protein